MDDTDLQLNFAEFCFDHFQHNDNTKDDQYKTPLGSKDNSPNGNESESIEVVETPSNTYRGPLQESTISSASTNNTDICVLDSHYANDDLQFLPDHEDDGEDDDDDEGVAVKGLEDEFVESEEGDEVFLRAVNVMDKHEDFTVLQKPSKARRLCNCEESTEVLMLINSEYHENRKPTYSGTDSDVEVLMSEEIIESDWSSANGLDDNPQESTLLKDSPDIIKAIVTSEEEVSSPSCLQQSCDGNSLKTQDSTDFDVSGEELVDGVVKIDKYQNLNRIQLLQIIQKQELCIQALEDTVERYQKAQQRLFEHVDALRLELSEIRITPLQTNDITKDI